ncbi:hypothetical protein ACFPME_08520 [Rhodanobacter umsongensis]|uniref:Uncharacterized protein n=1 Tax=Rhodanobacter umsongensis TaxID=633153 RepID=A0ABW0JL31_9GAMM
MNSIWKDLLFLHGHLVHKEDLTWSAEADTEADRDKARASQVQAAVVKCCMSVWPRLVGPR